MSIEKQALKQRWQATLKRRFITSFCMGFTSGAPLLVTLTLIQAWLTEAKIDLGSIGAMALVGLPYSLKFLWSPWLDYYDVPLLGRLGRRRGWLLTSHIGLIGGLFLMSLIKPNDLSLVAVLSLFIAFCSATQDTVVDAYRRDDLPDEELGVGSACYIWGYRLGMLVISGGGLIAADYLGWPLTFRLAALVMLAGPLTLMFSPEPDVERPKAIGYPAFAIVEPLRDFFLCRQAPFLILLFIFFYKFGDQLAASLGTSYYLNLGYSKTTIGGLVKLFGTSSTLVGVMLGGWAVIALGLRRSLWIFGLLQMVSTLGFALLYYLPVHPAALAIVVSQENLAGGAGSSAFVAFMAGQTNRSFSATQYALLSALMALPRTVLSAPAGHLVKAMNWPSFFILSTLLAIPAFFILHHLTRRGVFAFEDARRPLS